MKGTQAFYKISIFLILCLLSFREAPGQNAKVNWTALKTGFREFVEYPSGENAAHVIALLPASRVRYKDSPKAQEAIDYIFESDNFGMLERQVVSRNREAVRLAFRLHSIADGHLTEELNIMLGTLIRIDPKLFLEELSLAAPDKNLWDDLLGNLGPAYVDRFKARALEMELRIKALRSVEDASLIKIRNKCIETYGYFLSRVNKNQR